MYVRMQSCHVKAGDGTKLAVDVLLPKDNPGNLPLPCVLFQARYGQLIFIVCPLLATYGPGPGKRQAADDIVACRYTRGLYLRFPISRMTDGRPYDFINLAFKAELLLAGYAIISMDFRGTGKSLSTAQQLL